MYYYKWILNENDREEFLDAVEENTYTSLSSPILTTEYDSDYEWKLEIVVQKNLPILLRIQLLKAAQPETFCAQYKIRVILANSRWATYEDKSLFHARNMNNLVIHKFTNNPTTFLTCRATKSIEVIFEVQIKALDSVDICKGLQLQEIPDFEKLFRDPKYSDFIISCSEKQFDVHKNILAARSEVFSTMFDLDMKEKKEGSVKIDDFTPEIIQELLRYMFCGRVNNLDKLSVDLLKAADKYAIEGLVDLCAQSICKSIKIENALQLLSLAVNHNSHTVKSKIINFIVFNIKEISKQPEFKTLMDPRSLQEIITKTVHIWL